jgi:sulfate/thiosulfate transport system ATP-binding protein
MSIEIKNLSKKFGDFQALKDINLTVKKGELLALLGPSGCGKTTLLRIIAGLEFMDTGEILIYGRSTRNLFSLSKIGFVFQHYALFRHMTVFQNIAFGLVVKPKKKRLSKENIKEKVMHLLKLVQMEWAAERYPNQLSGGQRQRVALARTLAIEPEVLLLDEPFGSLDAKVRRELRRWLRHLHEKIKVTSLFVTHDQEEALELADRVVVMNNGMIVQVGKPAEIYEEPINSFVYDFMGESNKFSQNLLEYMKDKEILSGDIKDLIMVARPHEIQISKTMEVKKSLEGFIKHFVQIGPVVKVEVEVKEIEQFIDVEITKQDLLEYKYDIGDKVFVTFKNLKLFEDVN